MIQVMSTEEFLREYEKQNNRVNGLGCKVVPQPNGKYKLTFDEPITREDEEYTLDNMKTMIQVLKCRRTKK